MVMGANPALGQIQNLADFADRRRSRPDVARSPGPSTATGAGETQQMQDLSVQAGRMYDPTNAALQGLSGQVGQATGQTVGQLQGLAGQAAADTRSPLWQQTTAAVSGQLGNLDR